MASYAMTFMLSSLVKSQEQGNNGLVILSLMLQVDHDNEMTVIFATIAFPYRSKNGIFKPAYLYAYAPVCGSKVSDRLSKLTYDSSDKALH